jgi:hypothetical protein
MRRFCSGITGLVLAFTVAGCNDSAPETPLPVQPVNTDAIDKQMEVMKKNAQSKVFEKPQVETKPEPAPAAANPSPKKE